MIAASGDSCSSCTFNVHPKDRQYHPVFNSLLCAQCYMGIMHIGDLSKYYNGVDLDGTDNYCRYCQDGGDLVLCGDTNCRSGFCEQCTLRLVGEDKFEKIRASTKDDPWYCFTCNPSQIYHLVVKKHTKPPSKPTIAQATTTNETNVNDSDQPARVAAPAASASVAKPNSQIGLVTPAGNSDAQISTANAVTPTEPTAPAILAKAATPAAPAKGAAPAVPAREAIPTEPARGTTLSKRPITATPSKADIPAASARGAATAVSAKAATTAASTKAAIPATPANGPIPATSAKGPVLATSAKGPVLDTSAKGPVPATPAKGPVLATPAKGATLAETDTRVASAKGATPTQVAAISGPAKAATPMAPIAPATLAIPAKATIPVSATKAATPARTTPSASVVILDTSASTAKINTSVHVTAPARTSESDKSVYAVTLADTTTLVSKNQGPKRKLPISFGLFSTSNMCSKPRESPKRAKQVDQPSPTIVDKAPEVAIIKPPIKITISKADEIQKDVPAKKVEVDLDALEAELDMSDNDTDFVEAMEDLDEVETATKEKPSCSTDVEMRDADIVAALEAHTSKIVEQEKTEEMNKFLGWALKDAHLLKERLDVHLKALQSTSECYDVNRFKKDPNSIFSWASNLETFLSESKAIMGRCQHMYKFMPQLEKK